MIMQDQQLVPSTFKQIAYIQENTPLICYLLEK